jgi:hypothetical protein
MPKSLSVLLGAVLASTVMAKEAPSVAQVQLAQGPNQRGAESRSKQQDPMSWRDILNKLPPSPPNAPPTVENVPGDVLHDLRRIVVLMSPMWVIVDSDSVKDGRLTTRRYGLIVDAETFRTIEMNGSGPLKIATSGLVNPMTFTCVQDTGYSDYLTFRFPAGTSLESVRFDDSMLRLSARILSDTSSYRAMGEYRKGDLFVDLKDIEAGAVLLPLDARRLTVEFGNKNDRLNLAAEYKLGSSNVNQFIQDVLPETLNVPSREVRLLATDDMLTTCLSYKHTGKYFSRNEELDLLFIDPPKSQPLTRLTPSFKWGTGSSASH